MIKTYKDFNVSSSIDLCRLHTERDFAECVNLAIDILMESVRKVEKLSVEEWNPDTLRLTAHGISLCEGLQPDTARCIEYRSIPQALEIICTMK